MKLSDKTLSVLKNFASINSGLVIKPGVTQKTMDPSKAILVEATLEDSFPVEFGIYDLNQFLGNVTTLNSPELTFTDKSVVMDDGVVKLTYMGSAPNLIISPPDKQLVMKQVDVSFTLTNTMFQKIKKISDMNSLPHLTILGKDGDMLCKTHEASNDTSNHASIKLGEWTGPDFVTTFKTENFKLIPDDYDVEIMLEGFGKFVNKNKTVTYFIARETKAK